MTMLFDVHVAGLSKIDDMPGTWCEQDYRDLLVRLEVEDSDELSGGDLLEILMMALQDLEPDDAADAVLENRLGTTISAGARQNIVQDLLEGSSPWEEAADIRLHSRIFAAAVLLHKTSPSVFPKPRMMKLELRVTALKPEAAKLLHEPPQAAFVTRMLADGMNENSILERLFDEQLAAHDFPEAEAIIWKAEFSEAPQASENSALLTVYSSQHWLEDIADISEFQSKAYRDRPDEDDD